MKKKHKTTSTKTRNRGPLFGFGTTGYLETPSVDSRSNEDSVSRPFLTPRSRSLSLIHVDFKIPDITHDQSRRSISPHSSSTTMKSLLGGYHDQANQKHLNKVNLLTKLGGVQKTKIKAKTKSKKDKKKKGGNNIQTSTIQGLFEPNAIEVCDERSTTTKPSLECQLVLNETWPVAFQSYQFVYILTWNGMIYGGVNRENQLWIFTEPIPFPSFGMPQNTIIPLSNDINPQTKLSQKDEILQILKGSVPLPKGWNRLLAWNKLDGLQQLLFSWWRKLTNECVGPICAFNHALDPFTGHCLSRMLSLHLVTRSNFEFLKGKHGNRLQQERIILDDSTRAQLKWLRLDHLLLYQRTSINATPEIELVGVVERPSTSAKTATVRLFPYSIPVGHSYELNTEAFGLPEPYLSILLEHLRSGTRDLNSPIQVDVMDQKQSNVILLQMQQQMGDFLVLPSTCLFESSLEKPGVYIVKESACHVMNQDVLYSYEKQEGIPAKQATDAQKPTMFVAYLAERDSRHPDRVNVLAGFNSQMQLILPEYDLSLPIDLAKKIPSPPVEFSALMAPFVYDALTPETMQRINQLDFVRTLLPFSS